MIYFTKEEIIVIHSKLIHKFGGLLGYNDDLLEVCLHQPFQTFEGKDLYPNNLHKICLLCYLLIKRHPFVDGNKRIGMLILILGLRQNGYSFIPSNEEVIELGLNLANNTWGLRELISIVETHQK